MKRIILCGKAASGKDYMRDYLHKQGLELEVSFTTRPMRVGEVPGYTYNYVSREQFLNLLHGGNMYEHVEFAGKYYGTSRENWEKPCDVFIFTPTGLSQVNEDDRANCLVVYFDIPYVVRKERLRERSDWDSVARRLRADEEDFEGFCDYDLRVTNPNYDPDALFEIIKALRGDAI
jgi:guanylate kinase